VAGVLACRGLYLCVTDLRSYFATEKRGKPSHLERYMYKCSHVGDYLMKIAVILLSLAITLGYV
ncbi:MAG: hypothetical protein QXI22_09760, partial [Sulfolobales archaeon]